MSIEIFPYGIVGEIFIENTLEGIVLTSENLTAQANFTYVSSGEGAVEAVNSCYHTYIYVCIGQGKSKARSKHQINHAQKLYVLCSP